MNSRIFLSMIIVFCIVFIAMKPTSAAAFSHDSTAGVARSQIDSSDFRAQFLQLCDSTIVRLSDQKRKDPYFIDSYGVRGLCVAYDMTRDQKYLDACRSWASQMVKYQEKMNPAGAYYMNYGRKPGEKTGDWFVADCSSIAAGVLSTAVRCHGAERKRLIRSVERFTSLVTKNYLHASGGVTDGMWPQYDGAWWCSSGLFGSLSFMLYANTGSKQYLETGLKVVDWLNKQDLSKVEPLPLSHQGPSLPMYVLECYSAGWRYLEKSERFDTAQVQWCLRWTEDQQRTLFSQRRWPLLSWWGAKYGGLPFHQYIYAHYVPADSGLRTIAANEMKLLFPIAVSGQPGASQLVAFMMMSYAEQLDPGGIYRTIRATDQSVNHNMR